MLSIIVPCCNEQEVLNEFYKQLCEVLEVIREPFEVLFVDDGSTDGTLRMIKQLAAENDRVLFDSFSRNFGKEAAIYAGLRHTSGDYVAIMDADLQDPPAVLADMMRILKDGEYDCVAARRRTRKGEPPVRSFFAKQFYKLLSRGSDTAVMDGARDFRVMTRKMADAVISMGEYNRFSKGIFGWVGFHTYWLTYDNQERAAGRTKWSFRKLTGYAVDGMTSFSDTPLRIASWFGIFMTGFSFLALLFVIIRKLIFDDPVAGWASLVCIIIFIGGIQLLCLGIMGQYIAKIYLEVKNRPHYIIAETNRKASESHVPSAQV